LISAFGGAGTLSSVASTPPYYIPEKLPVSSPIEIDDELTSTISDATFQLGRIAGISPTVDFSPVLYTSILRLESVETAEIEGADVDIDEVYAYHTRGKSGDTGSVSISGFCL